MFFSNILLESGKTKIMQEIHDVNFILERSINDEWYKYAGIWQ